MKILLVQGSNYLVSMSGAYKANRILLQGLAANGHTCHVLSLPKPLSYDEYVERLVERGGTHIPSASGSTYRHEGIGVHVARGSMQMCIQLMDLIRELRPTWTLISEDPSCMLLSAALEADPARVVYLPHTLNLPFGPDCIVPDPSKTELLGRAAGILTVSNYLRDYIRRWGGLDAEAIYWPSYGSGPFPRYGNFDEGYVTLVNPCNAKGLPIFLAMARQMPDVEFAAVPTWGTGDTERQALASLPNVRILQAHEDVNKIFAQTRVLLAPSLLAESLGQVVVEAMARGIPVMASDLGGLPEAKLGVDYVLPVRQLGYELNERKESVEVVPEQDAAPWVEALRGLLGDRVRYERVAEESREAALGFIAGLGIEPFEEFLEGLAPVEIRHRAARPRAEQPHHSARAHQLGKQLKELSPKQRAMLAERLRKRTPSSNAA